MIVIGLIENTSESVPDIVMAETFRAASPELLSTSGRDLSPPNCTSPNKSAAAEAVIAGAAAATPVPVSVTVAGLPAALCVIDTEADLSPGEPGENVTVTVNPPTPVAIAPEVGVTVNAEASVPVTAMAVMERSAFPVLSKVKVPVEEDPTSVSPSVNVVSANVITGAGGGAVIVPLPVSATADGLPAALCVIERLADFPPSVDGVNVTVNAAAGAPGRIVALIGEIEKCAASVPDTAIAVTISAEVPPFPRLKVRAELWPTATSPKSIDAGDSVMIGTGVTPVPLNVTIDGLPAALCAIDTEADLTPSEEGVNVTVIVAAGAPVATVAVVGETVK